MEDIKEKIGDDKYYFLKNLQDYIGKELIFFGSVKRCDFIRENSDMDIAIITDNTNETIMRLKNFLNFDNRKIKKIFQKFPRNKTVVYCYKTNYDDYENNIFLEILIYDEKYKKQVLKCINNANNMPFYISYFLLFIKNLHYKLNIISKKTLKYIKRIVIENYMDQDLYDNLITINI